jgi:restriction endonuclease S subunit
MRLAMRDGWVATKLGEVADVQMGQSPPGSSYNTVGDGLPFLQGSAEFGEQFPQPEKWCSSPRKVALTGDLMMSVRAPVGDLNVAREATAVGRGLAVIRATSVMSEYLAFALEHVRGELQARSGGSMFASINGTALRELPLSLPRPEGQRRIVDLLTSLNVTRRETSKVEDVATKCLSSFLDGWLTSNESSPTQSLGALCSMRSGPSWKAADECDEAAHAAVPVLGITNSPVGDELDLSHIGWVANLPATTRRLTDSSLLMIRTNGNRARIGNVYRVAGDAVGKAYSAFQIGIFLADPGDRDLVYWQLRAPSVQRSISNAASGTTGLGNIALSWLKAFEIAWPDEGERRMLVAVAEVLHATRTTAKRQAVALRRLRKALLDQLLTGEREIPQSYDSLLAA